MPLVSGGEARYSVLTDRPVSQAFPRHCRGAKLPKGISLSEKHPFPQAPATDAIPDQLSEGASRILAAAGTLFAEQGYDAVSMSLIAQRAGISKANIYHHFKTKFDLYMAVVLRACKDSGELVQVLLELNQPLAPALGQFARDHLQRLLEHQTFSRIILRELLEGGRQRGEQLAQSGFNASFSRLADALEQRRASGELREDVDPAALAVLLIGANVFFFAVRDLICHYSSVDFADDPDRYLSLVLDIILHGALPEMRPEPR